MPILIVTKIKNLQEVRGGTGEKVTGGADFCRPKRLEYLLLPAVERCLEQDRNSRWYPWSLDDRPRMVGDRLKNELNGLDQAVARGGTQ